MVRQTVLQGLLGQLQLSPTPRLVVPVVVVVRAPKGSLLMRELVASEAITGLVEVVVAPALTRVVAVTEPMAHRESSSSQ